MQSWGCPGNQPSLYLRHGSVESSSVPAEARSSSVVSRARKQCVETPLQSSGDHPAWNYTKAITIRR